MKAALGVALLVAACGPPSSRPAIALPPPAHPELEPELFVRFTDRMGGSFALLRVSFTLDGRPVFDRSCGEVDDACRAGMKRTVDVLHARGAPGTHTLAARVDLRGEGAGVFSYIRAYHFRIDSTHAVAVERGRRTLVDATAWESGGPTAPLEQRPAMAWNDRFDDL